MAPSGSVDTATSGTYKIWYDCIDSADNYVYDLRVVHVEPAEADHPPVLSLSSTEVNVRVGGIFSLPSATYTGPEDGNLPYEIDYDDAHGVNTNRVGVYHVCYYCGDGAGNGVVDTVVVDVNP